MEADDEWRAWLLEHSGVAPESLDFAAPFERLREICSAEGIPMIYPIEAFREAAGERMLFMRKEGHPNMTGHALAARCLLEWLQSERGIEYEVALEDAEFLYPEGVGTGGGGR